MRSVSVMSSRRADPIRTGTVLGENQGTYRLVYGSRVSQAWPPVGPLVSVDWVVGYLRHARWS